MYKGPNTDKDLAARAIAKGGKNMSPTFVAILMLVVVVGCILLNKIPLNFIMFVVPTVCMFMLGYSVTETSTFILNQINTIMTSSGYMLMFGLIYFTMLTETGLFDIIINKVISMLGSKMNVVVIMVITSVISAVAYLTANMSTTYLIVFPVMMTIYKKYKMDRESAFILCQTAIGAMCWLPWGIGLVNSAVMAGVSPEELTTASMPWGLCFIPAIILQWIYFAFVHKKKNGTLGLPADTEIEGEAVEEKKENPNARPKLLWVNLILFIIVIAALAYFKLPSYMVFIAASIVTAIVNYPKDFGAIWNKAGATFFNVLVMLLAICFYLAAFNAAPADGSKMSMVTALAETMTSILPDSLTKYMFVIFLLLAVPILQFVPYQVYNAMYPLFISVGALFGFGSVAIIAPFVCNLALATSVTQMNSATYVGCTLCEIDVEHFCTKGAVIMFVTNIVVVITAIVAGVLVL